MYKLFLFVPVFVAMEGTVFAADVYWTTWNLGVSDGIYRADRGGGAPDQIITLEDLQPPDFSYYVGLPMDLAVDALGERMIFVETELDTIWSTDLSGSTFTELLVTDGEDPHQLEVDWQGQRIYWVEDNGPSSPARIGRCDLDGGNPTYLISDAGVRAGGIALDTSNGYIFWTESYVINEETALAVWRCGLDGSNAQAIISDFAEETFELGSIAADPEAQQVYWIQDQALIRRANYDGSSAETLYEDSALGDRSHLVLDSTTDELFWTSLEDRLIGRATLDGSSSAPLIENLPSSPLGIAVGSGGGSGPVLQLESMDGTTMVVTWTQPTSDWVLQSSPSLESDSWSSVPSDRITMDGLDGTAELDATQPQLFVRLREAGP